MKEAYFTNRGFRLSFAPAVARRLSGLLPSVRIRRTRPIRRLGSGEEALVVDVVTPLGRPRRLRIGLRPEAAPSRVREAIRHLKSTLPRGARDYPVFASAFLSPRVREICREEGVGFLDLAGNCLLRFNGVHIEKIVDKNPFPRRGRPSSLFSPVGSRIPRVLLEEPQRMWTVSGLAEAARVSLGHASNVTRRLVEEEYLARRERRLRLVQPARLLEAWRDQPLSPAASHAFYSFEAEPARGMARLASAARAHGWRYAVTTLSAASLVAPFVQGVGVVECYIDPDPGPEAWAQALDLRPVEAGPNLLLMIPRDPGVFYRARAIEGVTVVGDVQLYLDLARHPGRSLEQAEFLRQRRLRF